LLTGFNRIEDLLWFRVAEGVRAFFSPGSRGKPNSMGIPPTTVAVCFSHRVSARCLVFPRLLVLSVAIKPCVAKEVVDLEQALHCVLTQRLQPRGIVDIAPPAMLVLGPRADVALLLLLIGQPQPEPEYGTRDF
jgi:hypothetical protein